MHKRPVLLIVEDPELGRMMATTIDASGCETFVATSVGDALRLVAQRPYSLVVADYFGPLRQIWYRWPILQLLDRLAPHTPVLALSLHADVPKSKNLAAIVPLPDFTDALADGLKRHALARPKHTGDPFLARYLAALWDGNEDEASEVASEAMKHNWSGAAVYEDILTAALHEIGRWWDVKSCTVADEHGARVITQRTMDSVSAMVRRKQTRTGGATGAANEGANGRSVVLACVEGELHELGIRMAADVFTWAGWKARLLGANTPTDELLREALVRKADVVGLSATMQPRWEDLKLQITNLKAGGVQTIIVGGQAFDTMDGASLAELGATARADRASLAVELANRPGTSET